MEEQERGQSDSSGNGTSQTPEDTEKNSAGAGNNQDSRSGTARTFRRGNARRRRPAPPADSAPDPARAPAPPADSAPDPARAPAPPADSAPDPARAPAPPADSDSSTVEAVWANYFRVLEERIRKVDDVRYTELSKVRRRKAVLFWILCITAALTVINAAVVSLLVLLNIIKSGPIDSSALHNLTVFGGGLVGTAGITAVVGLARRAARSDEDILIKQGREVTRIEAVMVAARVTTDQEKRCEFLGDMTRSLNALLRDEEPETGRRKRRRSRKGDSAD
jgi:hypothetical protein